MPHLRSLLAFVLPILALTNSAWAHGNHESFEELMFREAHTAKTRRALQGCSAKLRSREALDKRFAKRDAFISKHLPSRDIPDGVSIFERQTDTSDVATCVLTPEGEEGPFYVSGELVREDVRESEPGVNLYLNVLVVDVNTCEPMNNVMFDFWNCNSTGVYSGEASENTIGLTYLRGLQPSDEDGIVQITTIVPGWYAGRAQHIHVKAHINYTTNDNGTISGGDVVHTGQMFFDQSFLSEVNVLYPYNLDRNMLTLNANDRVVTQQQNTSDYDAFVGVHLLNSSNLSAGVYGFINVAIDPTTIPAAAGGGGGGFGGGPGGNGTCGPPPGGFNGTAPPGAGPSGAPPSGGPGCGGASSGASSSGALSSGASLPGVSSSGAGSVTAITTLPTISGGASSTTATVPPVTSVVTSGAASCHQDNCFRQMIAANGFSSALAFCSAFTDSAATATAALPAFASSCTVSGVVAPSRISSACSCFVQVAARTTST